MLGSYPGKLRGQKQRVMAAVLGSAWSPYLQQEGIHEWSWIWAEWHRGSVCDHPGPSPLGCIWENPSSQSWRWKSHPRSCGRNCKRSLRLETHPPEMRDLLWETSTGWHFHRNRGAAPETRQQLETSARLRSWSRIPLVPDQIRPLSPSFPTNHPPLNLEVQKPASKAWKRQA